jgi:hypothetical protein
MKKEDLHERQLKAYRSAQYTADSLTKIDSPCYEYRARFICGIYFYPWSPKLNSLNTIDYNPKVLDREILFKNILTETRQFAQHGRSKS